MSVCTARTVLAAVAIAAGCVAVAPAHAGNASDAQALVLSGPGGVQATFVPQLPQNFTPAATVVLQLGQVVA